MELGKKAERDYISDSTFTVQYALFCLFDFTTIFFELIHEITGINSLEQNLIINDENWRQNRVYHIEKKLSIAAFKRLIAII